MQTCNNMVRQNGKAEWDKIVKKTETFWDHYLSTYNTRSVDENWCMFKAHVMEMLKKHVPTKFLTSWYNLPWFNRRLKSLVRKKQNLYNWASKSQKPAHWHDHQKIKEGCKLPSKEGPA